ncbi:MAG: DUF4124 domain-containing protein [Telluria sp.]
MNRRIVFSSVVAVCLAASGGGAQADIVKCIDSAGHVTLTDLPCGNGTVVPVSVPAAPPPAAQNADPLPQPWHEAPPADPLRVGAVRIHLAAAEFAPRHTVYSHMTRLAPSQVFTVDAATLRAARTVLSLHGEERQVASR